MIKYACPTPAEHCIGNRTICNGSIQDRAVGQKARMTHNSGKEAFTCYARYLVNILKYTQVGSREFDQGEGKPILVLDKKSRFGARLRSGKEDTKGQRVVPNSGGGMMI